MSTPTKHGIAVCGYIRENFDKKCWIDEIIAKIIQFYVIHGGSLYMCGNGVYGRLGIEKYKNDLCKTLTLCPPFTDNNALKISAGSYHTLIIDTKGEVWYCGLGEDGQLGNGKTNDLLVPTKLNLGVRVVAVSAGDSHSLFLCDNGTMEGCGSNACGQIGLGHLERTLVPRTIKTLKKYKVVQISTGAYHSVALTEDGDLFCFGYNGDGMCGVGQDKGSYVRSPTKVGSDDIEFVECGYNHTLVITRKGLLYSFGGGKCGNLGHGACDDKYTPTLIDSLKGIKITMCGAGERHSLCIDEDGIIWSFGSNESGQCGLSVDITIQKTPKVIEWFIKNNIKAQECFAGDFSSSIIAHDRTLYVFGSNKNYQLGVEAKRIYYIPTKLCIPHNMAVQSLSMGYEHTAIICSSQ